MESSGTPFHNRTHLESAGADWNIQENSLAYYQLFSQALSVGTLIKCVSSNSVYSMTAAGIDKFREERVWAEKLASLRPWVAQSQLPTDALCAVQWSRNVKDLQ